MKQFTISTLLFLISSNIIYAQNENIKYDLEFHAGLTHPYLERIGSTDNKYIGVGYNTTVSKSLRLNFNAKNVWHTNLILGVEAGLDEFTFGYGAGSKPTVPEYEGGGIAAMLASNDRIILYKIAPVIGYELPLTRRLHVRATLHPSIALYPHSKLMTDTTYNSFWWNRPYISKDAVWIMTQPPKQNNGLHFLAKVNTTVSYKFSRSIAGTFSLAYQKGFSDFLIDNTHIYMPFHPTLDNKMYTTKVDGTSFQFHFGLRWYMNQLETIKKSITGKEAIQERRTERKLRKQALALIPESKYRYDISVDGGLLKPFFNRSTVRNQTIETKSIDNLSSTFNLALNAENLAFKNSLLGLEIGRDEFSYGLGAINLGARSTSEFNATVSLKPVTKIFTYKLGAILGYKFDLSKKIQIRTTLHPTLAYSPFSNTYDQVNNQLGSESKYPLNLWMVRHPATQNEEIHFMAKVKASLAYKFSRRFAGVISFAYQKGFSNFFTDNTQIYRPSSPTIDNNFYQTELNGTSTQTQLGLRYYLNR